ncbi:unnamed protein product [Brassica oleracea]
MKNASKESAQTGYNKFLKQQKPLRDMVNSAEWSESKWPKEAGAKKVRQYPMDMAKETITKDFKWNKEKYEKAFEIIDKRWECQLHHPLHAAGYFLNPSIHYKYHDDVRCEEVEGGLYNCITRSTQDKIMAELDAFKNSTGIFGHGMAIRQRDIKAPALKRRSTRSDSVTTDPIILDEIDESNEWLIGRMDGDSSDNDDLVWEDDDLPLSVVSQAMGAEEPNYSTRGATGTSTSKTDKGKGVGSSNQKKNVTDHLKPRSC